MTDIWDAEEPGMVDRGDPICPVLWNSREAQCDLLKWRRFSKISVRC